MIRRKLLVAAAIIASVVLTACSDMTAPKNDVVCPVTSGSSVCHS
jgi:outer membrane murein-binding lipoprotein Lpp